MKKITNLVLALLLMVNIVLPNLLHVSYAETLDEKKQIENDLKTIGVLIGGDGVDSTSNVTRQEMVVVLIRMLGKEQVALENYANSFIPFTDVANWARPYIAYAYNNNLTKGTSATTFSGTDYVDINQASTFMLRILGYEEGTDYVWNNAYDSAVLLKIVDSNKDDLSKTSFIRSNLNTLVKDTLSVKKKNSNTILIDDLILEGAIDKDDFLKTTIFSKMKQEHEETHDTSTNTFIILSVSNRMYNGEYVQSLKALDMNDKKVNFITRLSNINVNDYYELEYYELPDEDDIYMATSYYKISMPWISASDMFIKSIDTNKLKMTLTNGKVYDISKELIIKGDSNSLASLSSKIANNSNYTHRINKYVESDNGVLTCIDYTMDYENTAYDIDINNFEFGSYYQNSSSYKEPIEWLVLEVDEKENKVLIISKYTLDAKLYNEEYMAVTWKDCTLRKWLNDDFIDEAFSLSEQSKILYTSLSDSKTNDKVFLLNIKEVENYFKTTEEKICYPTKYAANNGAWLPENGASEWWLRDSSCKDCPQIVSYTGESDICCWASVISVNTYIRPAMWISLE